MKRDRSSALRTASVAAVLLPLAAACSAAPDEGASTEGETAEAMGIFRVPRPPLNIAPRVVTGRCMGEPTAVLAVIPGRPACDDISVPSGGTLVGTVGTTWLAGYQNNLRGGGFRDENEIRSIIKGSTPTLTDAEYDGAQPFCYYAYAPPTGNEFCPTASTLQSYFREVFSVGATEAGNVCCPMSPGASMGCVSCVTPKASPSRLIPPVR